VFRHHANDQARTTAISEEIEHAFSQRRKVLVLTERTDHLDAISTALDGRIPSPFVLHGRMSRTQRAALIGQLEALPPEAPRILLATGKLVGEGFDDPPLDCGSLTTWIPPIQPCDGCGKSAIVATAQWVI
jgi:superfamily II DNA or RNA helicase